MSRKKEQTMHHEYFTYCEDLKKEYGEKTIVMLQCGSFFEIYGLKEIETNIISGSKIVDAAKLLGFHISEKKINIQIYNKEYRILMAGLPVYSLDKNIPKLVDHGYTVALYIQVKQGKECHRVLDQVFSPGTFFSSEITEDVGLSNNIMCIWIEKHKPFLRTHKKDILVYGASVLNVFTGEICMVQNELPYEIMTTTFDELERFVVTHNPNEVVFIYDKDNGELCNNLKKIVQFSGILTDNIQFVSVYNKKVDNCTKSAYIKEIITELYDVQYYDSCNSFFEYQLATQSMCYLLNFVKEHNKKLVRKLKPPVFNNVSSNIILANHTLSQLNIISNGQHKKGTKMSSVLSFLNSCKTIMGKRLFEYQLTSPTNNTTWLQNEYDMIENLDKNTQINIKNMRNMLKDVADLDKLLRNITMEVLSPSQLYSIYNSISIFKNELSKIQDEKLFAYLVEENIDDSRHKIFENIDKINNLIKTTFNIQLCKQFNTISSISENLIVDGIDTKLDECCKSYQKYKNTLQIITDYLNSLNGKGNTDWIKSYETDKKGLSLRITKTRSKKVSHWKTIKVEMKEYAKQYENYEEDIINQVDVSSIEFSNVTTSDNEIKENTINKLCKNIENTNEVRQRLIVSSYKEFVFRLNTVFNELENVSKYIAKFDVIINKLHIAKEYKYVKPEIDANAEKSYFDAKGIRHCLIEQLQEDEIYVNNDISLGNEEQNGILLFGTNAVGKTSLIRSIGVTIIMAQSGMYVPCSSFVYKPYTAIFSRILGNDNLFRGLSTFAVEMSELRTILELSDKNSLILGDELCSGTESESALSIFVAGLQYLNKNESSFIFATHFHEVIDYEEIKELDKMSLKHLEVVYDREQDCLIYDRKLKNGSGPRTYGLEVCKSLSMKNEFIEKAFQLRNKYFPENAGTLSNKKTKYNAAKIRGMCELCKEAIGTEIHHLEEQQDADENGFIGSFHKNHKANLVSICEKCHDDIHNGNKKAPKRKKKTTKGIQLI